MEKDKNEKKDNKQTEHKEQNDREGESKEAKEEQDNEEEGRSRARRLAQNESEEEEVIYVKVVRISHGFVFTWFLCEIFYWKTFVSSFRFSPFVP